MSSKQEQLQKYSDPKEAQKKAVSYLGKGTKLFFSTRKDKKYMVEDPEGHWVHFGQMGYEDFTRHMSKERRDAYLKRARNIKGNWKANKYSPNNLSINILW